MSFFKILHRSKKSKARLGEIKTAHGVIKTPSFVAVGTKGTIKSILPSLLKEIGTQAAFVNTYHLLTHPGADTIEKAGGIHRYAGLDLPLMSDSGGFQVFSLARNKMLKNQVFLTPVSSPPLRGTSQVAKNLVSTKTQEKPAIVKISEDGVKFRSTFDGRVIELTPEKSIAYQKKIGADLLMAFDECIPYGVSYQYTKEATERTHHWLERSIKEFKKFQTNNKKQYLYGIIQGGVFEDLRKESAKFVVAKNTDGVAIGGVSVGESKKEMRDQVRWVADYLPMDRPVHLLGVGHFDDILDLVSYGIDTFDCVEPTRLARMGNVYQLKTQNLKLKTLEIEKINILKGIYREDFSKVDENCDCYVCRNFTKSYLHHLFKNRELLAYTLATYHNLWVMERFFKRVREVIAKDEI